ncbi:MAG: bifunctional NADP-dependent methylenetetrahydromethanopterin dehydrogenase/methylenetetrahydrofolate dehydrogenase [Gemmataceae bacterium]
MSDKRRILIQLDPDEQPSVFDRIVALDAGADLVLAHGRVRREQVQALVHGAIFTRGPKDLTHTAIFVGGSDVAAGEQLLEEVQRHFLPQFGLTVSVMLDANGCNTTAAAAVHVVARHVDLRGKTALVLGGTGPVGQRAALLLARLQARVRLASRSPERAAQACERIRARFPQADLLPVCAPPYLHSALAGAQVVISAGAAGVRILTADLWQSAPDLAVLVDLNAVPPTGIEGIEPVDTARQRMGKITYGAIGVGSTKMKIHKACIARLFQANNLVLDAEAIYDLAASLDDGTTGARAAD